MPAPSRSAPLRLPSGASSTVKLLQALRRYPGQEVVVGVSGGADSVGLLRALLLVGARPVGVHLDHALRPESAADAAWVQRLCADLGLPLQIERVDVAAVAQRRGWNLEDAARRVRYDVLARTAKARGAGIILTAHTRRDQAETVLMQLLRGEAVLGGIPPIRGRVQRPWLAVPRRDIEQWLRELGQDWREDASNADVQYTRAWLRLQVMPVLEARFPGLEASLARLAVMQTQDDAALHAWASGFGVHTPLRGQPLAALRRWVRQHLKAAGLTYHAEHLAQLAGAIQQGETLHLTLPQARAVTVTGGRLFTGPLAFTGPAFDVPQGWQRRTRQSGDRIRLPGGTRKLSDVLGEARLPRDLRDDVPLLVSAEGVQWVGLNPPIWALGAREVAGVPADPLWTAMGEALALAQQAAQAQEVPVGAVVLGPTGEIVGRGRNTSRAAGDLTQHAELAALRGAAATLGTPYLGGCTLVVTLEPCPMCLGAALEARVGHLVYGAVNPKAGALGGVGDLLAHHWGHAPRITGGVRAHEAARLLRAMFAGVRGREGAPSEESSGESQAGTGKV